MAFRPDDTSTSCADVMYRSRKSLFSSALVASRSKSACSSADAHGDAWSTTLPGPGGCPLQRPYVT